MWETAVVEQFKALPRHFLGGTEENYEQSRSPVREMNPGPPEYELRVLPLEPDVRFKVPIVHSMKTNFNLSGTNCLSDLFLRNLFGKLLDSCILRKYGGK
jgi:hypothetical protein